MILICAHRIAQRRVDRRQLKVEKESISKNFLTWLLVEFTRRRQGRPGIAADAAAAVSGAEAAEAANFNLLALLERTDDAIENRFDDGLRLLAGEFGDAQDLFDEVGFRKCGLLGHRHYASSSDTSLKPCRTGSPYFAATGAPAAGESPQPLAAAE